MGVIPTQQNAPAANLAGGHSTSLPSATVALNAAQHSTDVVLIAAVAPEQQNEFVGMTAEQLMQLDLYFVPGGETPATSQSGTPAESEPGDGDSVCPEGQFDSSIFGSLEPAADEPAAIVAAADPNAAQVEGIEQAQENPAAPGACIDDLTELSLLELMSVRVSAEPTPILPQLQPVDLDTLFDRSDETENNNRENLNEESSEDTFFPPVPDPVQTDPPFNVSPIAGNDKFAIAEDGTLTVTGSGVLKNDTDGNGDALSVSLISGPSSGTLTLNANGRFTYTPNADFNGTDSFTYQVSDGNGGFDSASVLLTVTAVNDAPVLAAPGTIAVTEDTPATVSGISVTDVDIGTGNITVTLSVPSGTLAATGTPGVAVGGTASALTLTGTLADINAFLGGSNVTYTPALNNGTDVNLTVTVNDKGNTGTGGAKTDSEVVTLDVQAVNDAPVAAVPASIIVTEDVASAITGISFSDVDAGTGNVTVTLSVTAGTLAAATGGGVTAAGSGTGSITLTGTVAAINSFISGGNVAYTTAADDTAAQTLTVSIDDGGNTGSGGAKTDSETVALNVTAVNDAPVLTVPGTISIDEDVTTALTGISVADIDAGTGNITVTLSAPSGALAATSSATVTVGGTAAALTLTGTLAEINAFIAGANVTYTTALNNDADVNLTVTVNDKGNTGTGGAKTDSEVVTLDVQAVNDAPVAAVPASIIVTEDVASAITGISFSDVDAGTGNVTVTLSVTAGTLAAATGGGVAAAGSGTGSITLTGTVAAINSFISGGNVAYTTAADDTAAQTLTVSIDDGGNTGSGGAKTDSETVALNVTAVNDAPVLTVPGTISIDEDVTTALTGISVADIDAGTGNITVTLSAPSGALAATCSGASRSAAPPPL